MDVGLNNRNLFEHELLKDVAFLVEATSDEMRALRQEYSIDYWDHHQIDKCIELGSISSKNLRGVSDEIIDLIKSVETRNEKVNESRKYRVKWEDEGRGVMIHVGAFDKRPVYVEFSFAYIKGKKVAFYNGCSELVDHKMINDWLIKNFQLTNDGYTRWNRVDAINFHNCINALDRLDKEPRDTVYNG